MSREMRDSGIEWIGDIPKEWKIGKVKNFYSLQTGFTPDTKNELYYDENGALWVNISDIGNSHSINDTKKRISDLYLTQFKPKIVPKGSLLYSFKLSVGAVAIAGENLYTNEAIAAFLQKEGVNLAFLFYSSQVCIIFNANENIYGAKLLNQDLINNATIIFPPLSEQQKIADYLDKVCGEVDELVALQEKMIEELKAYKQSVIKEAVTKGLNPNVPMKDSGINWIGEIPEHWKQHQFRRLFEIKKNIAGTLGYDVLSVTQGGIKVKDLTKNEGQIAQDYSKYQLVDIDDYVMNHMDLLTGYVDCANQYGVTSPDYRVFRAIDKTQVALSYYLRIFQTCYKERIFYHLGQGVSGMGRWRLPAEQLKLFVLPMPPLDEQCQIAAFLDTKCSEIDALIAIKEQKIEELKEYKKSVIYEYVTGKKEVV